MKNLLATILFLLIVSPVLLGAAESGPRRTQTVDPTFQDWGNSCRVRGVSLSTLSAVVVSTYPTNSGLDIAEWRFREIVNMSTGSNIRLIFGDDLFTTYSSSVGVVISSDITGAGFGDKYVDRSQTQIRAIQSGTAGIGGAGVSITEYYQH